VAVEPVGGVSPSTKQKMVLGMKKQILCLWKTCHKVGGLVLRGRIDRWSENMRIGYHMDRDPRTFHLLQSFAE
jgi:hypothetical protein